MDKISKTLEGCSKNFRRFFDWSLDYLCEHHKKVQIVNRRHVIMNDSQKCSGWCDGSEIVVARKNPLFEQVYVHEFSHMTQAIEESPLWEEEFDFWNLLYGKGLLVQDYERVFDVIALERDCEKRSVSFSKKWKLFDEEQYARQANVYLHYYQYLFLTNKWINSTSIYHPLLLQYMPEKIQPLHKFKNIDMDLMRLFYDCLDKKGEFYQKGFKNK